MKIKMKKIFLLLLVAFFSVHFAYADCPPTPPPDGGPCEECNSLMTWDSTTCEYVSSEAYENCVSEHCPGMPINSNILILFATAIALGGYFFYKNNKKRPLKN